MARIPLRYRLPNPPAGFVGRQEEVSFLAEAVKQAPVTAVVGPGGLGKTALVLHMLHRKFKRKLDRTLFVPLGPAVAGEEVGLEVLRALALAESVEDVDWASLQGDPDATLEALLDLAEDASWWVVLDDVHGDVEVVRRTLSQLSRYARQSRWIATSRMDPRAGDAAQVLALGGLSMQELEQLARSWASGMPEDAIGRALHLSGGSPWILQQCLASGRSEPAITRTSMLEELPGGSSELLEALAVLSVPVPIDLVRRLVIDPSDDELRALEQRGMIEVGPAGLRVHEVVRGVLVAPGTELRVMPWLEKAARVLSTTEDPELLLEALRLWMTLGHTEEAVSLLDRHGTVMFGAGFAPRMWKLLEPVADARLARWRLRCASQLGNPTALGKVREPDEAEARDRLAWVDTLYMQGQLEESCRLARQIYDEAVEAGDDLSIDAGLTLAACLGERGERGQAIRQLQRLPDIPGDVRARRDVLIAQYLAGTPQGGDALRLVEGLRGSLGELTPSVRDQVAWGIANVYRQEGRLEEAAEILRTVQTTPRGGALSLFLARRATWLQAEIDLERGALASAEQGLDQLSPFLRSPSLLRPHVSSTRAGLRLAQGKLEDLDDLLDRTAREARGFDVRDLHWRIEAMRVELGTLEARDAVAADPDAVASDAAELLRMRRAERAARRDGVVDAGSVGRGGQGAQGSLGQKIGAWAAWVAGEQDRAAVEMAAAVRAAATGGLAVREAELRDALCELWAMAGRENELRAAAEELTRLASTIGSGRFSLAARLWEQLAEPRPRWAVLEQIALADAVSPPAARRARLLLGGEAESDQLDRAVVTAARRRPGWRPPRSIADSEQGAGWTAGWGLDPQRQAAWLPDGTTVPFARRALHWRLLHTLAQHGGQASKERLVVDVWEEAEYHPLKHDARLQVAIRKLRELLEDDPGKPQRIVTTDEGYALAGPVRIAAS